MKSRTVILLLLSVCLSGVNAQEKTKIIDGVEIALEVSGNASTGDNAPLWLTANRQGKVSAYGNSAYERAMLIRSMDVDSMKNWRVGYGVDLMARQHNQSALLIHQAYAQVAWKKISLTLGAKEREIDLRNNELTSGGLSQGINATPIPEALVNVDYFTFPGTKGWWQIKGRLGYGITTDSRWQKRWIGDADLMRYTDKALYHEKALYFKFGQREKFPLTYEIGLQMMTQFGGTAYHAQGRGITDAAGATIKMNSGFNGFLHALLPFAGSDVTDGVNANAEGNTLGSWNMRLQWAQDDWSVAAYLERFYEDHSMMFIEYGLYDHLAGVEVQLPKNKVVRHVLVEHVGTKDQSGPFLHDPTSNMPERLAGNDQYYNHNIYTGWQHWGYAMGNPLLTSPIYNDNHELTFRNNRISAWHVGLDGQPCDEVQWRVLATWTRNHGTYNTPFYEMEKEQHYMAEATYLPRWAKGWQGTLGVGVSHGALVGNTFGGQLTIRKTFKL